MLSHDLRDALTDNDGKPDETKDVTVVHWVLKYVLPMKGTKVVAKFLRNDNNMRPLDCARELTMDI